LTLDIGGNGLSGNVPQAQLAKGFHAAFWFGFGASVIAALTAMTLRIGTRGHKGEKDLRNVAMAGHRREPSAVATGNDVEIAAIVVQRTGIPAKD
jgi:hypothetical protein